MRIEKITEISVLLVVLLLAGCDRKSESKSAPRVEEGGSARRASLYDEAPQENPTLDEVLATVYDRSALRSWARSQVLSNPREHFVAILKIEEAAKRESVLVCFLSEWSKRDPHAASAAFLEAQRMLRRVIQEELVPDLMASLSVKDVEAGWRFGTQQLKGDLRARSLEAFIATVAARDLDEAVHYWDEIPPGGSRRRSISPIVQSLAEADLVSAVDWINGLSNSSDSRAAIEALGKSIREGRPESEEAYGRAASPNLRGALAKAVALNSGDTFVETLDALNSLGEIDRENVSQYAFRRWAVSDLDQVLTHLEADPNSANVDSYYEVATAYGRQSPEAAADWAIGPIGKNSQSAVLAAVVDIWLGADPMAASAWVGRLEDPALKTTASVRVVEYLLRLREIEDARRWIEVIPDSNARQDIRERYSLE